MPPSRGVRTLLVRLRLYDGGDLVVIVVHLKAGGGAGAWEARRHSTTKLKTWLDANLPTDRVLVLGDFNDDVTTSIFRSKPSPFSAFLEDLAHYRFVTRSLSEEGVSSTVNHAGLIDHQIASDELMDKLVPGSVEVLRLDRTLPSYRRSTSDHLPVTARYRIVNDAP